MEKRKLLGSSGNHSRQRLVASGQLRAVSKAEVRREQNVQEDAEEEAVAQVWPWPRLAT